MIICTENDLVVQRCSSDRNEFVRQFQSDDCTLVALLSITAANSGKVKSGLGKILLRCI